MKKLLAGAMLSAALLLTSLTAFSQSFPATEKEVADLLTTGKWKVKWMQKGEKKVDAEETMQMTIQFFADGTYEMELFGEPKKATWKVDFPAKRVNIFETKEVPESYIIGLTKDEFTVRPVAEGDDFLIIFVPVA